MWCTVTRAAAGQSTTANPALAVHSTAAALRIDGRLDEAAWAQADSIPDLTQVEPLEGAAPTGRTVVRVLVTANAVVFGVTALDPDPAGIVGFSRARDADLAEEDHVRLVLDTFLDGRSGHVFAVNPNGARYDALVSERGESADARWDAVWEAAAVRVAGGWSVEIRIPVQSLIFRRGLHAWGFNIERRIQRLQETSRWAGAHLDYRVTQTSHAGRLTGLPLLDLGVGLTVRPSVVGDLVRAEPKAATDGSAEVSLDASERITSNLLASLTVNTDFAETEADVRQTNLTRFPLFFPEKRTFFLEGADLFDFGLGLGTDVLPFFSRRLGLVGGEEVPLVAGGKVTGRAGGTNLGALVVRTGRADTLPTAATMAVARLRQNILQESSVGVIATVGDPLDRPEAWTAGADVTFQTSRLGGDNNFLVGVWGLAMDRVGATGDRTAAGFKVDYPNDLWDVALTYKRIGDGFDPSLGFVPRPGVHLASLGMEFAPRPGWRLVRQMFYELRFSGAADLDGRWESYRVFTAPLNWRLESGDRFEFNIVPTGEQLSDSFEVADGIFIPPGPYHWWRYRLEGELAAKRKLSGQVTWWFGGFFDGALHEIQVEATWKPSALVNVDLSAERNAGRLPQGDFTQDLVALRLRLNWSPDLSLSSLVQYDNETESLGSNTRLRWTFEPLGDLFVVYNHNLQDRATGWGFDSNQLLIKAQYAWRF